MAVRAGISVYEMLSAKKWPNLGRTIWYFLMFFFVVASVEVKIPNGFGTQHESVCVSKGVEQLRFYVQCTLSCDLPDVFLVNLRPETLGKY